MKSQYKALIIAGIISVPVFIYLFIYQYQYVLDWEDNLEDSIEEESDKITVELYPEYEKHEIKFKGDEDGYVKYKIETDGILLWLYVTEDGYDDFREKLSIDDIAGEDLLMVKTIEDEKKDGEIYFYKEGYFLFLNNDTVDVEVDYEFEIIPLCWVGRRDPPAPIDAWMGALLLSSIVFAVSFLISFLILRRRNKKTDEGPQLA